MTTNTAENNEAYTLTIKRLFKTDRERVFDAWVTPEVVSQWLSPDPGMIMEVDELDAKEGGRYQFQMTNAEGEVFIVTGEYVLINRPEQLIFTWKWIHGDDHTEMLVTLDFVTMDGATEMQMVHEKLPDQASKDHHNDGWLACFDKLAEFYDN